MIVVVDSGVANLASVTAALGRLGVEAVVTSEASLIQQAERVILPGVGAAAAAMERLRAKKLIDVLRGLTQPVLGICLGMQVLFERSEENGGVPCLGVLPGTVKLLPATSDEPVPHMGWNQLSMAVDTAKDAATGGGATKQREHPLLKGIRENAFVYFVHSYAAPVGDLTVASTRYGMDFTAIAARGNFMGCQFHPERSGVVGSRILRNFLDM